MDVSGASNSSAQESRSAIEVSRPGRYVVTTGILLLLTSVSLNVILASRVRSFNHLQSIKLSERLLKVGSAVAPIMAKRMDGQRELISYQGAAEPTVLYEFTPSCSSCALNMDNFKALVDRDNSHYLFLALSLSRA